MSFIYLEPKQNRDRNENKTNFEKMAEINNVELLKMASATINRQYSGEPLGLTSFIDSVTLLESLATTPALKTFLLAFVKTKLDGRAREFITETDNTIEKLITTLRQNIKPDNSKVVEGRILALCFNPANSQDFGKQAEELAESFRRALVVEGIPSAKANEMAVEKTIEVCRTNTRLDLVKSILEASRFEQPKEVIAKLIIQVDKARHENQVLSFKRQDRNGHQFKRNQNFNSRGGHQNSNGNNSQNYGRGNSYYRGRGRGTARGRGGFDSPNGYNGQNNYNGQNYNQGRQNYQQHGNVRVTQNQGSNPQMRMGFPPDVSNSQ